MCDHPRRAHAADISTGAPPETIPLECITEEGSRKNSEAIGFDELAMSNVSLLRRMRLDRG